MEGPEKHAGDIVKSIVLWPIRTLAKPIDAMVDRIRAKRNEKLEQDRKIAENSELYSDFSVKAAEEGKTSFSEHMAVFRANSLSFIESLYNTVYIKLNEKCRKQRLKDDCTDIPLHPMGWKDEESTVYKKNIWDVLIKALGSLSSVIGSFASLRKGFGKKIIRGLGIAALALLIVGCSSVLAYYIYGQATEDVQIMVSLNGNELGMIENKSVLDEALAEANTYMSAKTASAYNFDGDLSCAFVTTHDKTFISEDGLCAEIIDAAKEKYVSAYVLYIDGVRIAANSSYSGISSVIDSLENAKLRRLSDMGASAESVRISNTIRIENLLCLPDELISAYDIYLMLNGSEDIIFYQSVGKETVADDELSVLINPLVPENEEENAHDDLQVSFFSSDSDAQTRGDIGVDLVYTTVVKEEVTEEVAYETVFEYSEYYDVNQIFTKTYGHNGEIRYTYEVSYVDGEEVSKVLKSTEYITEPVNEVIVVGIANLPEPGATGKFQYPVSGYINISSGFNDYRANTITHYGIDITGDYGTPILASDGGTVIKAESYYSYGNIVIIDHGNGYQTYYAHLNKILVNEGDLVYQGQVIAQMGATGAASGPHLHFETRHDDVPFDPLDVLPELHQQ